MLDAARVVRPNLYICAELFTGDEAMDLTFVQELGINSLIRECGNAWDPKEFSRLLYRYGLGKPIGSMDSTCMVSKEEIPSPTGKGPIRHAVIMPLTGSLPHALLYDLTHDNESPLDKRSAEDALSTGSLAAFSFCGVGSVKGFDDLYPKLLNLVHETRKYEVTGLGPHSGIARVKRVLSELHLEMVLGGYEEGHVHQENDVIDSQLCVIRLTDPFRRSILSFPGSSRQRKRATCLLHTLHSTRDPRTVGLVIIQFLYIFSVEI
jgi:glycogen debranching enzyme